MGPRLQDEDGLGGDARHYDRVGVLFVAEPPRPVTAKVERSEPGRSHLKGETEDGSHSRLHGRRRKRRPSRGDRVSKFRFKHGPVVAVRVHTGPSPRAYCNCSIRSLILLVVHSEPPGVSDHISMTPAPLMPVASAQTWHSRFVAERAIPATDEQGEDPGSSFTGAPVHGLSRTATLVVRPVGQLEHPALGLRSTP